MFQLLIGYTAHAYGADEVRNPLFEVSVLRLLLGLAAWHVRERTCAVHGPRAWIHTHSRGAIHTHSRGAWHKHAWARGARSEGDGPCVRARARGARAARGTNGRCSATDADQDRQGFVDPPG